MLDWRWRGKRKASDLLERFASLVALTQADLVDTEADDTRTQQLLVASLLESL